MTHERTHERARPARRSESDVDAVVPGQISRSAELDAPVRPEASGLVAAAGASSGASLPGALLQKFESSLGADLSGVRVHTDDTAAAAADAVGAKAYALGQNIHFAAGHYDPSSPAGEHLLAHEVAHTVQQAGRMQFKLAVSSPGDHLELEADRAADAMVAGQAASVGGAAVGIARAVAHPTDKAVDDDRKKAVELADENADALEQQWDSIGGNLLLALVRGAAAAWKEFRKSPASGMTMPGRTIFGALPGFQDEEMTSALREHASRKLGAENLTLLAEMMAMHNQGESLPRIFNVAPVRDPKHEYDVSFTSAKGITMAKVHYKNHLPSPWEWTSPPIAISGFSFSINVLKPKFPVTPGLELGGSMKADKGSPALYWGWRDFGGGVQSVDFPSAGVSVPIGGAKVTTGSGVLFTGGPGGQCSFSDLAVKLSGGSPSAKPGEGKPEYKIGFGGKSGVAVVGDDALAKVDTAAVDTKARLVDASKDFRVRLTRFTNGSSAVPDGTTQELAKLVALITDFVAHEFGETKHAEALKQNGIDPAHAFEPTIEIQGWASMRWVDSKNDAERNAKNLALSEQRAKAAGEALLGVWGPWTYRSLDIHGMGAGVNPPSTNDTVDAAGAQQKLADLQKALIAKREALAAAKTKGDGAAIAKLQDEIERIEFDLETYKDLASPSGAKAHPAEEEWIRQAVIFVRWNGKVVDLGAASMSDAAPGAAPSGGKVLTQKEPSPSITIMK